MSRDNDFVLVSTIKSERPKYIIALCDGTGKNGWKDEHTTNVYRLYRRIINAKQKRPTIVDGVQYEVVAQYFPGIGCDSTVAPGYLPKVFGANIVKMVAQVYMFIRQAYRHGDRVCIFGYSRGAFTARKVASLLFHIGCSVNNENELLEQWKHRENGAPWAKKVAQDPIPVKYLGVWDTVGSVYSLSKFKQIKDMLDMSDDELPISVENALHAVAFHENRKLFRVTLFDKKHTAAQLQEVWFAGSHSDVGGGGNAKTGLSDITLNWMIRRVDAFSNLDQKYIDYNRLEKLTPHDAYRDYGVAQQVVDHEETRIQSKLLTLESQIHPTVERIDRTLPAHTRLATFEKLYGDNNKAGRAISTSMRPRNARQNTSMSSSISVLPDTNHAGKQFTSILPIKIFCPTPKYAATRPNPYDWTLVVSN